MLILMLCKNKCMNKITCRHLTVLRVRHVSFIYPRPAGVVGQPGDPPFHDDVALTPREIQQLKHQLLVARHREQASGRRLALLKNVADEKLALQAQVDTLTHRLQEVEFPLQLERRKNHILEDALAAQEKKNQVPTHQKKKISWKDRLIKEKDRLMNLISRSFRQDSGLLTSRVKMSRVMNSTEDMMHHRRNVCV